MTQTSRSRTSSRRSVLKTIGAGLATGGVFSGTAAAGGHTFAEELNTVRETTRKYRDVDVAEADGYNFFGVVPHAGIVYENLEDNLGNLGLTDPPALLFYAPSEDIDVGDTAADVEDTHLVLAGIEYLVEGRHGDDQDIFDDENASRRLKVSEAEGWHPAPDPNLNVTGLHAWVHMANPNGVFARDHPVMIKRLRD